MFGYVIADREKLTQEQKDRYKAFYCGICRSLYKNHGAAATGVLSYDMAFLVLVLSSLYEPETVMGSERCVPHPLHPHDFAENIYSGYAADMTILLAYHKALDDWEDEKKISSKLMSAAFRSAYERTAQKYPRQTAAIETGLRKLSELEEMNVCDPDAAAGAFGGIMRELFIYKEDNWKKTLGDMAYALGQFIYIMDAFVDLKGDLKHGRYNPLSDMRKRGRTDEDIHGILTMLIGECAINFEKLPLIENVDIMRNILYSGVWTKFRFGLSEEKENGGETAYDK